MFIFGFPITESDNWSDDPFAEEEVNPETLICEACHIYEDIDGTKYIGFNLKLGLDETTMKEYLAPFSSDLKTRKVVRQHEETARD